MSSWAKNLAFGANVKSCVTSNQNWCQQKNKDKFLYMLCISCSHCMVVVLLFWVDLHRSRNWPWLHNVSNYGSLAKGEDYRSTCTGTAAASTVPNGRPAILRAHLWLDARRDGLCRMSVQLSYLSQGAVQADGTVRRPDLRARPQPP